MNICRNLLSVIKNATLSLAIFFAASMPSSAQAKCAVEAVGISDREAFAYLFDNADFIGYVFRDEDKAEGADRKLVFLVIRSLKNTMGTSKFSIPYAQNDTIIMGSARKHLTMPIGGFELVFLKSGTLGFHTNECLEAVRSEVDEISLNRLSHDALQDEDFRETIESE